MSAGRRPSHGRLPHLHYAFYPIALIIFGILLRTGVLHGAEDVGLTIVPAGIAGLMLVLAC